MEIFWLAIYEVIYPITQVSITYQCWTFQIFEELQNKIYHRWQYEGNFLNIFAILQRGAQIDYDILVNGSIKVEWKLFKVCMYNCAFSNKESKHSVLTSTKMKTFNTTTFNQLNSSRISEIFSRTMKIGFIDKRNLNALQR